MANWCYNESVVYSKNKAQIEEFYKIFKKMQEGYNPIKNDWGREWLGNFYLLMGKTEMEVLKAIKCRGNVEKLDEVEITEENGYYTVCFNYYTAWNPIHYELEREIKIKFPDLKMVTYAEEEGCLIFVNTDKEGLFFKTRYILEIYENCCLQNKFVYFNDLDNALKEFNECTNSNAKTIQEAIKRGNKLVDENPEFIFLLSEFKETY